jgi:signal peptidase I
VSTADAPKEPRYLSRLELAKLQSQTGSGNAGAAPVTQKSDEAVIRSEHTQITFADVLKTAVMYAVALMIAIVLSVVIVKYVGQKTQVSGNSMNDTLVNADQLIIDKISYRSHDPQRYDIVVFPENEDSMYVKRIIGLPGETVSISEGYIYINGQMLGDDIYGKETITQDNYGRLYESSVTLGSDEYFVMGDNRNNSTDSRSYDVGNITKDQIIGKVIFRIWPLKRMGVVD